MKYGQIVAKSWSDPAFKQRLVSDPKAVLQEYGIEIPAGVQVRAVENTQNLMHLLLPPQPQSELNDEELQQVAGGAVPACVGSTGTASTWCGTFATISTAGSATP